MSWDNNDLMFTLARSFKLSLATCTPQLIITLLSYTMLFRNNTLTSHTNDCIRILGIGYIQPVTILIQRVTQPRTRCERVDSVVVCAGGGGWGEGYRRAGRRYWGCGRTRLGVLSAGRRDVRLLGCEV